MSVSADGNDRTATGGWDGKTDSNVGPILLAGRYRIVRQLGQGGMGAVWLAEDTKLDGLEVAVKMLPSVLVNNKRAYAQVKAEALVSLKLSHPNIATVRAFEEENGSPFLVMDYIDGETLDDYLAEKGKLTEEETIRLLAPVAAALDYAHTQGVVHRDIKPGNVMIRKDGVPFVLDFGIAREIQETMTRVTGKLSSGTLLYMSPEQLDGDAPKPAQDVYSFAATVYECLKGEPPFARGGIEDQIRHKEPAPLGPQFANCGPGVRAGLAKSPEARPATCTEVLSAGAKDGGRRKTRIVIVGVLLALSALVGVGGWWMWKTQQDAETVRQANEMRRLEASRRLAEEKRQAEERRVAEEKRQAEERRVAEEERKADERRQAEAEKLRLAEEKAAKERAAAEQARLAEEKRAAEEKRREEERRFAEERQRAEAARKAAESVRTPPMERPAISRQVGDGDHRAIAEKKKVEVRQTCDCCRGTGRRSCGECGPIRNGAGDVVCEHGLVCSRCGGSGMRNTGIFAEPCSDCRGRGWERHAKCAGSGFLAGVCPKCRGEKTICTGEK